MLSRGLAIVGSRNPTPIGRETAMNIAKVLAGEGHVIVSGLAAGIDAAAHMGALESHGSTIAVCASGLDIVYPRQHLGLARRIGEAGLLLSEYPPGTGVRRHHFPYRNRLISGMTLGTLVVEATRKSGSLITARHAADQGREVFAVPGSVYSPLSKGPTSSSKRVPRWLRVLRIFRKNSRFSAACQYPRQPKGRLIEVAILCWTP